jgi:beta-glucanase (GH16 family)
MGYECVWQDLFAIDGSPDSRYWQLETGGHGFGNHEEQFYTDRLENAFVKDGILTIRAVKENYQNCRYTSAKLTTYGKRHIEQGRIEIMAKLPVGHGTWPAIWLLGTNMKEGIPWPTCGEIDMMEHVGHAPDHVHFSLHSKNRHFHNNNQLNHVIQAAGLAEDFHEYALEWEKDYMSFYLDRRHIVRFDREQGSTVETWPFNQPFYLILNLALGGIWGGKIDDSSLPASFQFSYVKVYERK